MIFHKYALNTIDCYSLLRMSALHGRFQTKAFELRFTGNTFLFLLVIDFILAINIQQTPQKSAITRNIRVMLTSCHRVLLS